MTSHFDVVSITLPFIILLVGFFLGILVASLWRERKNKGGD